MNTLIMEKVNKTRRAELNCSSLHNWYDRTILTCRKNALCNLNKYTFTPSLHLRQGACWVKKAKQHGEAM